MELEDNFKPPIKSRTTRELIEIAAYPEKWTKAAFQLAQEELVLREANPDDIRLRRRSIKQMERNERQSTANEPFCFLSLNFFEGFIDWGEVFTFLFSWGLEKEGLTRKAEFQRKYRPLLIAIFLLTICILFLGNL